MGAGTISFAFDIGTNSIGWSVLGLDNAGRPARIIAAGVRVFPLGAKGRARKTPGEERRAVRMASRRRDSFLRRRKATIRALIRLGLLPPGKEDYDRLANAGQDAGGRSHLSDTDPYMLRARALAGPLSLHEVGRALLHLGKRRGRIAAPGSGNRDDGPTPGEILARRRARRMAVRQRPAVGGRENGEDVLHTASRDAIREEFMRIWNVQAPYHREQMTEAGREQLLAIMFHERLPSESPAGRCRFLPCEPRLAKAHPLFQRFRIYKELNEMRICLLNGEWRALSRKERDILAGALLRSGGMTFDAVRSLLELEDTAAISCEVPGRTGIAGDETAAIMRLPEFASGRWDELESAEQCECFEAVHDWRGDRQPARFGEATLFGELQDLIALKRRLPVGTCRYGRSVLSQLVALMSEDVICEAEAARRAGFRHWEMPNLSAKQYSLLPDYQEILWRRMGTAAPMPGGGYNRANIRLPNDIVHVALNQLRRACNALIRRYGLPARINLEMARKAGVRIGGRAAEDFLRGQRRVRNRNLSAQIAALRGLMPQLSDNRENRLRLSLWQELNPADPGDRKCIYSGRRISAVSLFSGEVEIDHIIPRSMSNLSGSANLTVCFATANRLKRDRVPAAVGEWTGIQDEIRERAKLLPTLKARKFESENAGRNGTEEHFPERQLADTRYLARLAREYLACLFPARSDEKTGVCTSGVNVVPGRLTALLRREWTLDRLFPSGNRNDFSTSKCRKDHRQHAVDAIIIGAVTPGIVLQARYLEAGLPSGGIPVPWRGFDAEVKEITGRIIVSYKADNARPSSEAGTPLGKTAGKFHNASAYSLTGAMGRGGKPIVARRKALHALVARDIANIRDPLLRLRLMDVTTGKTGCAFGASLAEFARTDRRYRGIRRVRLAHTLDMIVIRDSNGRACKGYRGCSNYRYDVWELSCGRWMPEVVTMFDAHQPDQVSAVRARHHNPKKVLSLRQYDMVALVHGDAGTTIARVIKFSRDGRITLAAHNEAGDLKARDRDPADPFRYIVMTGSSLKAARARQLRVDELGNVFDPGPRDAVSRNGRDQG